MKVDIIVINREYSQNKQEYIVFYCKIVKHSCTLWRRRITYVKPYMKISLYTSTSHLRQTCLMTCKGFIKDAGFLIGGNKFGEITVVFLLALREDSLNFLNFGKYAVHCVWLTSKTEANK